MGKEEKLIKNTALYMVGNITSKIIAFLLVPLYTHYLNKLEMGTFDLILNAVTLIIPLITLSSVTSIFRFIIDDSAYTDKILTNGLLIIFLGVALSLIPFCIFASIAQINYFGLIVILLICMLLDNTWKYAARGTKNNFCYALSGVIQTFMTGITAIIFIIGFGWGIKGILLSYALAPLTSFIFLEYKLKIRHRIKFKLINKNTILEMLKYSVPLIPNDVSWWLIQSANRFIIKFFLGVESNGLYAVSSKFPSLLMTFNSLFNMAWTESAIEEYNSINKNEYYSKVFNMLMKVQFSVFLIAMPITKYIFMIMIDESYSMALYCVPFLMLGAILQAFAMFYGTGFLSSKETKGALSTTAISALMNILFLLCTIKPLGLVAAGIAESICYGILWITRIKKTKKYFDIKIDNKALVYFILMSTMFTLCFYMNNFTIDVLITLLALISFYAFNKEILFRFFGMLLKRIKKA